MPHILELKENTKGRDLFVGDIHGNADLLQTIVDDLKPDDRLFIVGDLIDNRDAKNVEDDKSFEVLKMVLKHDNIFVTCGNHEELCIEAAKEYDALEKEGRLTTDEILKKLSQYEWDPWFEFTKKSVGGKWFELQRTSSDSQQVKELRRAVKYLESLPYIIYVKGKLPFLVVHSDMPFDDATLHQYLKTGKDMSTNEIHHAVWARQDDFAKNSHRTKDSILGICGHNLMKSSRPESNMINLDVGGFLGHLVVLILSDGRFTQKEYRMDSFKNYSALHNQSDSCVREITEFLKVLNKKYAADKPLSLQSGMWAKSHQQSIMPSEHDDEPAEQSKDQTKRKRPEHW